MARNRELIDRRNATIKKEYKKLLSVEHKGKRKYTYDYVLEILSEKYFLTPDYISQIIMRNL